VGELVGWVEGGEEEFVVAVLVDDDVVDDVVEGVVEEALGDLGEGRLAVW
jgi:nitrogen regulatory protein PII